MMARPRAKIITIITLLVFAALAGSAAVSAKPLPNQVLSGVRVDGAELGGRTRAETRALLARAYSPILAGKLPVKIKDQRIMVRLASDDPAEPPIFGIDLDATVAAAWTPGHRSGLGNRIALMRANLGIPTPIPPAIMLDQKALSDALKTAVQKYLTEPQNATLQITMENNEPQVTIEPEKIGEQIDADTAIRMLIRDPARVRDEPLALPVIPQKPEVSQAEAERMRGAIDAALARAPLTLTAKDQSFEVSAKSLASMLAVSKINGSPALIMGGPAWEALIKKIATAVDVPVQEARFEFTEGRVAEFSESREGVVVDQTASAATVAQALQERTSGPIALPIKTVQPQFTVENLNTFGIRERVGRGVTSFAGSPTNRRKNIRTAVSKLNGLLIPQGETFSLLKALGDIDSAHGWLPELVIKGDRTIPEFGGGLCQIATTAFRVALDAGLPIVERQNHSYRVSYYEPPVGMDATIYDPKPDFKFKNDYPGPLLFTASITPDADHLTFELWGAKDGRVASSSVPVMWNVVRPPEKKVIETSSLKPGKEVCIEKPHAGADAKFTYTITYPDGREEKKEFKSHYRPWGAVCLVGVEGAPEISVTDARKADPAAAAPVQQRTVGVPPTE